MEEEWKYLKTKWVINKGPPRVWHKNLDIPGLAMSRSMGDSWGAQVGVISIPDIKIISINPNEDWFLIVGSDGVWEFLK